MKVGEIGAERYEQNISFISNSESRKDKYMTIIIITRERQEYEYVFSSFMHL